jgi:predicted amidohydrolase
MALAQFTPMAGDVDGNLSQMQALLGTGALQHAELVCFPELCLPGYLLEPAAYTAGFLADLSRAAETLEQTARERQVRIVYGTAEASAGALRNVVVITDPGRARTRYAKTHMVQAERIVFTPGNHLVLTADGVLALGCCYDLAFPGFCAGLADAGARVLIFPMAWETRRAFVFESIAAARAVENVAYVVCVNQTGSRRGGSRTSFSSDGDERHALRQSLLLGSLFPRGIDRASSCLPRLGDGRPIVRGESDCLIGCDDLPFLPPPIPTTRNDG